MKVLVVTPRYFPQIGGVETHVREVTSLLRDQVAGLTVVTCDPTGDLARQEVIGGVAVERVKGYPRSTDWSFSPGLFWRCATSSADLIHLQGIGTAVAPASMLAAWLGRTPYVVTFHTGGHSSRLRARLRGVQWRLLRPLLRRAAALVAVSEAERRLCARRLSCPEEEIRLLRNGTYLPEPGPRPAVLGPASHPVIVCVGRLERFKGQDRLVRAMPAVLRRAPNARLLLVGTGNAADELQALVQRLGLEASVQTLSFLPSQRQEMADILRAADVCALLSDYEAHPVAVMEALWVGTPVLGLAGSGFDELAREGLITLTARDADPQQVAADLLACAGEGRRAPWRRSWQECAEETYKLYEDVTSRRAVPEAA